MSRIQRLLMNESAQGASLALIMIFWGLYLGYPLLTLQHVHVTFLGHEVPAYYFITAVPILMVAAWVLLCKRGWTKWELLWCLLPLTCLPGIATSDDPVWSVRQWLSWMVRGTIPGGVIFLSTQPGKARKWLFYWIYPIVIAASLLGLTELYTNHNPLWENLFIPLHEGFKPDNAFYRPTYETYHEVVSNRPWGTQGNRTPYACFIIAFLPLALWLLKYEKRHRWAQVLASAALFSILLLSQVRAAWLGMLAMIALISIVGLRKDWRENIQVVAGALILSSVFLAWPKTRGMLWERVRSFQLSDTSIRERVQVLRTASALKTRWPAGVGFGQFPKACRPYYPKNLVWNKTPDNQYLRWALENGLPSFGLLLAFLVGLVRAGWRRIRRMEDVREADFYKSLLVGWAGIGVTFFFFDGFYWGACNMTFWAFLGLFATCLNTSPGVPRT